MKTSFPSLRSLSGPRNLGTLLALVLGLLLSTLKSFAGVTLLVNGGSSAVVSAGDPITFTWEATPDTWRVERGWGERFATELPLSGSESIRAANPAVATSYGYFASATTSAGVYSQSSVQVTVLPAPVFPAYVPIVWAPGVPDFEILPLTFYIVPDAQVGVPYSAPIAATGREPITYGAVSLPEGLTIVGNTITGIPTTNAFIQGGNFTLTATDADGYTSATLARMMTPVLYPRVLTPVQAPVVFDGGTPEINSAYVNDTSSGLDRAATGFTLQSATTVTGIRVWGTYLTRFKAGTDNFTIKFYDRGPSPISTWPSFPAAGRLIGAFTPTGVTRNRTGRAAFGVPDSEYVYDLGFSGITLHSNTLYYVCVVNTTQGEKWGWMPSEIQNYPSWGAYSQDGGLTFPGGSFELAFQLKEGAVVTPPPPTAGTATYKLVAKTNGKGTVVISPAGTSSGSAYPAGTVVTLTATPDPTDNKSIWKGWTGDVTSASRTITVTVSKAISVQANFR